MSRRISRRKAKCKGDNALFIQRLVRWLCKCQFKHRSKVAIAITRRRAPFHCGQNAGRFSKVTDLKASGRQDSQKIARRFQFRRPVSRDCSRRVSGETGPQNRADGDGPAAIITARQDIRPHGLFIAIRS